MKATFEEMKAYIIENDLAHLVRELTTNIGNSELAVRAAVEYVYDQHTLTKEEFIAKYF